jgi:hypothetical protein
MSAIVHSTATAPRPGGLGVSRRHYGESVGGVKEVLDRRGGMGSVLLVRVVVEPAEFAQDYPRCAPSGYSPRIL